MRILMLAAVLLGVACHNKKPENTLSGTYRLVESITIKEKDTVHVIVDSTKTEMIKMLNGSHFAFLNHDRNKGQDSTALFVSGGGRYTFSENKYTEHLDYCSYRAWEGKSFTFTMELKGDSLIQHGEEKIPELNIKQYITEKYVKIK